MPADALNGVGPGLVERLPGGDIRFDIRSLQGVKTHLRAHDVARHDAPAVVHDGHAGHHRVLSPAEAVQHVARRRGIGRLAKDVLVEDDDRVGAQHPGRGKLLSQLLGFCLGQAHDIGFGPLRGVVPFVDMRRHDAERQFQHRQEFTPSWGSRGEDQGGAGADDRIRGHGRPIRLYTSRVVT